LIFLYGDPAGILQISRSTSDKIELKPERELGQVDHSEIQQVRDLVDSSGTRRNCDSRTKQLQLVAGAGFEPATFRL